MSAIEEEPEMTDITAYRIIERSTDPKGLADAFAATADQPVTERSAEPEAGAAAFDLNKPPFRTRDERDVTHFRAVFGDASDAYAKTQPTKTTGSQSQRNG